MAPASIGGYRLIKPLGMGGGEAEVWLAEKDGSRYAVKFLKITLSKTLVDDIEEFREKAELWKKLVHPNIVRVIDYGARPAPYIVMELCQRDLRALLNEKGRLDSEEAVDIVLQVAKALEYAHYHGVVHRDIKPENILICGDKVKVADWGIAKVLLRTSSKSGYAGTPLYSAPEQLDPETYGKVDWRTDIWQVGCLLYEMLEGEPPFQAEHPGQLVLSILTKPPKPYRYTPEWLRQVITKCLEKNKEKRWRSISIIIEMLETRTIPRKSPSVGRIPPYNIEREFIETLKTRDPQKMEILLEKLQEQYEKNPITKNALMLGTIMDIMGIPTNIVWQTIKIAEDELEEIAQKLDNDEVYTSLGNGYLQIWRLEKAKEYYDKALRKNLEGIRTLIGLAWISYYKSDYDEAIRLANQILQKQENIEALLIKAWAEKELKIDNRATYRRLVKISPKTPREKTIHAYAKCELGEKNAVDILERVLEKYPNYVEGLILLALINPVSKAIKYFEKAAKINPDNAYVWCFIGTLKISDDFDGAIRSFRKAIEIYPDCVEAWYGIGLAYVKIGNHDEAMKYFKKAVEINPKHAEAWRELGLVYAMKGSYDEATEYFKKAMEITPNDALAWRDIGVIYGKKGDFKKAIEYLRRAVELNPNYTKAWYELGFTYYRMGNLNDAIECFNKVLCIDPSYADAWFTMGFIYLEEGYPDEALKCFKRTVEIDPNYAKAWGLMALVYLKRGNFDEARRYLRKACELEDKSSCKALRRIQSL